MNLRLKTYFPVSKSSVTILQKAILTFLLTVSAVHLKAQQEPQFTQYMLNTLTINPAYSGSSEAISAVLLVRQQWVGFDGAPSTQTVNVHSPLVKKNIALGLSLVHDKIGPVKQTGLFADFAYRVLISENSILSAGIKFGIDNFSNDLSKLVAIESQDNAVQKDIGGRTMLNVGFGLYYQHEKFYTGFSIPKLIQNEYDKDNDISVSELDMQRRHYYLIGGGIVKLNKNLKLKPSFQLKMVSGAPVSFDLTAGLLLYDRLMVGMMYRAKDAIGGIVQYDLMKGLKLGYAYDLTTTNLSTFNSGTHEILISYDYHFRYKKFKSPRYF